MTKARSFPSQPVCRAAVAAMCLCGAPALAVAADMPPVQRSGDVSFVSGGIGDDQAQAFKGEMKRYPLALEIVRHVGGKDQYTADADVRISDAQGKVLLQTVARGPFLLADLPPGNYDVDVTLEGKTKRQRVSLGAGGHERQVFVFRPESESRGSIDR
jgi:hypothetical protein